MSINFTPSFEDGIIYTVEFNQLATTTVVDLMKTHLVDRPHTFIDDLIALGTVPKLISDKYIFCIVRDNYVKFHGYQGNHITLYTNFDIDPLATLTLAPGQSVTIDTGVSFHGTSYAPSKMYNIMTNVNNNIVITSFNVSGYVNVTVKNRNNVPITINNYIPICQVDVMPCIHQRELVVFSGFPSDEDENAVLDYIYKHMIDST